MTDEEYKKFEEDFNKKQDEKYAAKAAKLDEEFPLQERILRFEQMKAKEKQEKEFKELEEFDGGEEPIDTSQFKPLTAQELIRVLGLTIKKDELNKLVTFLAQLSAYTESSQLNVSFNAPSSSGKSFIPLEISYLFPEKDVVKLGGASPTAFFHDQGVYDKETNTIRVDLARKIIIFLDQPNGLLLEKLRSFLSHDEKEIHIKITDKNRGGGNRTKNVILLGFPVVIFCTAGLNLDEQETTRFLLLSPEVNHEKLREAIHEKIKKEADNLSYKHWLESDPDRQLLKNRILAIKQAGIVSIKISNPELVTKLFFEKIKTPKPRHQRDIGRILSLIKVFALVNLWFRERNGTALIASEEDINEAFKIWDVIAESQELNIPPYVLSLYKEVILAAYMAKNGGSLGEVKIGITKQDIVTKHFEVYGRLLSDWQLRLQIIPLLESAGLIGQEQDPTDKRKTVFHPIAQLNIPQKQNYIEESCGDEAKSVDQLSKDEQLELGKSVFGEGTKWAEREV